MEPILIISSFPREGQIHSERFVGIASYTKNLLNSISGRKIVFGEILDGERDYKEGEIEVKRVWKRGSPFVFFSVLSSIAQYRDSKTVIFEFEHAMFGGVLSLIPIPLFLLLTDKILKKKVIFVFHQVIGDINSLSGHLNINAVKSSLLNPLIWLFYRLVILTSDKVVVFEDRLKDLLRESDKITVIPHGIEDFNFKLTQKEAKKVLGLEGKTVLLCFGFLAWYKGSDFIVKESKNFPKNYRLVLAGGPNPNHVGKKFYDQYIEKVIGEAEKNNVLATGFIPEEKIAIFFKAADLVIFPYRTFMSSSGPLSLCFSFNKPFIVSKPLAELFKTYDFEKALNQAGLSVRNFTFNLIGKDLGNKIEEALRGNLRQSLIKFTSLIAKERDFGRIAVDYEKLLSFKRQSIRPGMALEVKSA